MTDSQPKTKSNVVSLAEWKAKRQRRQPVRDENELLLFLELGEAIEDKIKS